MGRPHNIGSDIHSRHLTFIHASIFLISFPVSMSTVIRAYFSGRCAIILVPLAILVCGGLLTYWTCSNLSSFFGISICHFLQAKWHVLLCCVNIDAEHLWSPFPVLKSRELQKNIGQCRQGPHRLQRFHNAIYAWSLPCKFWLVKKVSRFKRDFSF